MVTEARLQERPVFGPGSCAASGSLEMQRLVPDSTASAVPLTVDCQRGFAALEQFASDIDRLNPTSARPNPFLSSAFLLTYAGKSEYRAPSEVRVYLVREGDRIIGCAPMRLARETWGFKGTPLQVSAGKLQFLASIDTEQPGILCSAGDAARVTLALIEHICAREFDWEILELVGQIKGSAMDQALDAVSGTRFRRREIRVEPYNEIPMVWDSIGDYFQGLAKKMRSNISRQARRLYASGEPQLIFAEGAQAVTAWFEPYRDLDSRSWKNATSASIDRDPRRVDFYREIAAGRGGLDPAFIGILFDGVLIAGLLIGSNETASPEFHGAWCLEMAYDQSIASLGPGQLLLLLAVGLGIEKAHRHLNFMQNFSYYKHRWGAEPIDVSNLQLLRKASLYNLRATLGDLRKQLQAKAAAPQATAAVNEADEGAVASAVSPAAQTKARALADAALAAYTGTGIRRLDRRAAQAYLPFELK